MDLVPPLNRPQPRVLLMPLFPNSVSSIRFFGALENRASPAFPPSCDFENSRASRPELDSEEAIIDKLPWEYAWHTNTHIGIMWEGEVGHGRIHSAVRFLRLKAPDGRENRYSVKHTNIGTYFVLPFSPNIYFHWDSIHMIFCEYHFGDIIAVKT